MDSSDKTNEQNTFEFFNNLDLQRDDYPCPICGNIVRVIINDATWIEECPECGRISPITQNIFDATECELSILCDNKIQKNCYPILSKISGRNYLDIHELCNQTLSKKGSPWLSIAKGYKSDLEDVLKQLEERGIQAKIDKIR